MRSSSRSICTASLICGAIALASCGGSGSTTGTTNSTAASTTGTGGTTETSTTASAGGAGGSSASTSTAGAGGADAGVDAGPVDPCGTALFCEKFDTYAGVTDIADKQKFGPWHAALKPGAVMNLDSAHTISGSNALHVHIDNAVTAGGRLFADGAQPIFANKPTHVYGRMMMYIEPNGTSIHWTFFGVNGSADSTSPAAGRNASYIMSSLPKNGVNTYSFVYGLQAQGADGFHDCSSQAMTAMPTASWSCISFDMDSVARKLRMYKDGAVDPILSVDDHGKGCVAPTAVDSPWYGPEVTQLFVGAWSFHQMNAPLDVWIDDLVVDDKPVACPAP
jgi:hypothetical protein